MQHATSDTPAMKSLQANGIRIARYQHVDAADLLAAVRESLIGVSRWLPWCHPDYGERDALEWIEHCDVSWRNGDEFAFAVRDLDTHEFLGGVGLNQRNRQHNLANLGYWIRQSRQGAGIAVEAARLAAAFGFQRLGLSRIEILTQLDNMPSRRVAEKLGASFEGVARNRLMLRDTPVDAAVYSLLPPGQADSPR